MTVLTPMIVSYTSASNPSRLRSLLMRIGTCPPGALFGHLCHVRPNVDNIRTSSPLPRWLTLSHQRERSLPQRAGPTPRRQVPRAGLAPSDRHFVTAIRGFSATTSEERRKRYHSLGSIGTVTASGALAPAEASSSLADEARCHAA